MAIRRSNPKSKAVLKKKGKQEELAEMRQMLMEKEDVKIRKSQRRKRRVRESVNMTRKDED